MVSFSKLRRQLLVLELHLPPHPAIVLTSSMDQLDDDTTLGRPVQEIHSFQSVDVTASGNIYVPDSDNVRIRRITGTTVETIAGAGTGGYRDSDAPLTSELYGLEGLAVVSDGSCGEALPYNRLRQIAGH